MDIIRINAIKENPSLVDGPGYRTVVFLQGCTLKCPGCHNKATWDINKGREYKVSELALILKERAFNKKITISGGEPLMQSEALLALLEELKEYDLCLYTGRLLEQVPREILKYLKYIKTGPYIKALRTTTTPYIGSSNQQFIEVNHEQ